MSRVTRPVPAKLAMLFAVVLCAAGAPAATPARAPEGRRAPALNGGEWLNSRPLTRADLAGKVVLVEFWTFDCINCRRTVPAMKRLHERFGEGGEVVIVGVHTPELAHERDPRAVQRAIDRFRLPYPVLLDNAMANWLAFDNHYWPALYIIDRRGVIRDLHIGELHEGTPAWRSVVALIESLRREPR